MPRGFSGAMMRSSSLPPGPSMLIVSARGDFGGCGNAPNPCRRRARTSWIVSPVGSASSRAMISLFSASVSAGMAAGSNDGGIDSDRRGHQRTLPRAATGYTASTTPFRAA